MSAIDEIQYETELLRYELDHTEPSDLLIEVSERARKAIRLGFMNQASPRSLRRAFLEIAALGLLGVRHYDEGQTSLQGPTQ